MSDITSMLQNNIKYIIILFFILSFLIFAISITTIVLDSSDPESDNQTNMSAEEFHDDNIDFFIQLDKLDFIDNQTKQQVSNQHINESNYSNILNSELLPETTFQNISQTIIFGSYDSNANLTNVKSPDNIQIGFITTVDLTNNEIQNKLDNQTDVTKTYEENTLYLENEKFNMDYVTILDNNKIAMSNSESYINEIIDANENINIENSVIYNEDNIVFEFKNTNELYNDIIIELKSMDSNDINNNEKQLIDDLSNASNPESIRLYKNNSILKYEQEFDTLVAASRFNRIFGNDNYQEMNINVSLDTTKITLEYNLQDNEFNQPLRELSERHKKSNSMINIQKYRNDTLKTTIDERNNYDRINIINSSTMETVETVENDTDDQNETEIVLDDGDYIFEGVTDDGTIEIIESSSSQDTDEKDTDESEDEQADEEPDVTSTTEVSVEETDDTIIISVDENERVEEFLIIDPDAISHRMGSSIGNSEEYPKVEDGSYRVIGILQDGSEELIKIID